MCMPIGAFISRYRGVISPTGNSRADAKGICEEWTKDDFVDCHDRHGGHPLCDESGLIHGT